MSAWSGWRFEGDDFLIKYADKELVEYWEGERGYLFEAAWGIDPPELAIPSAEIWAEVMPEWLLGHPRDDGCGSVLQRTHV